MTDTSRRGSITIWAWLVSLGVHIGLLAVFAFVKFSQFSNISSPATESTVTITQIEKLTKQSRIWPKPKIKRLLPDQHTAFRKKPMDFSGRVKIEPPNKSQQLPKISGTGSIALLSGGGVLSDTVEFFGQKTNLRKICYVVDCSGSMQGLLGRVRKQLKDSIANLQPDQYFYIIFFRGEQLLESGHGRLVRATTKTKSAANDFIDSARPGGTTNAINALERAMRIRDQLGRSAELIYFLTDGLDLEDGNTARFSRLVENLRKKLAPAVKINTIGFWAQHADCEILRAVARRSGGEFINIE
jgi:hypothetical protein